MENKVAKGEAFYINNNNFKRSDKGPDMTGKLILTTEEFKALIQIYEEARENGGDAKLQIDIAAWKGKSKQANKPYLYCKHEVYFGPRKESGQSYAPKQSSSDDDWD